MTSASLGGAGRTAGAGGHDRGTLGAGASEGRAVARAAGTARTTRAARSEVVRGRGSRAVRGADTRVVLRTTPGKTDAGVSDGISLHLVDGHLSGVAVDELDETAALARRDLDVSYLAETLEEAAELVFSHVAREAADENRGVVGIGELVHLLLVRSSAVALVEVGGGRHAVEALLLLLLGVHGRRHVGAARRAAIGTMVAGRTVLVDDAHTVTAEDAYRFLGVAVEMRMGRFPQ